jgi:hypothetical protein
MRLSLLALVALAAALPAGGRGEDLPAAAGDPAARAPDAAAPTMPPDVAADTAARADEDARAAASSGLALPASIERERAEAKASLARHGLRRPTPRWGLALGAGFPDFATASLVFRPLQRVRLHAGPAWNGFGWGVQGGVTFVPWSFAVSPLLSFQAGRFFGSDLSFLAKGEDGAGMKPLLEDMVYSYAAADVGLELGSQRGLSFTLRLGLSYVSVATHGTASHTSDGGTVVALTNPSLNATLPSAKLGFQYWF